jgi:hypothetical protein
MPYRPWALKQPEQRKAVCRFNPYPSKRPFAEVFVAGRHDLVNAAEHVVGRVNLGPGQQAAVRLRCVPLSGRRVRASRLACCCGPCSSTAGSARLTVASAVAPAATTRCRCQLAGPRSCCPRATELVGRRARCPGAALADVAQREFAKFVHSAREGRLRTCSPRLVPARG